jgi:hypothetical protein
MKDAEIECLNEIYSVSNDENLSDKEALMIINANLLKIDLLILDYFQQVQIKTMNNIF